MAKYLAQESSFDGVAGELNVATKENPAIIVRGDDVEPSRTWTPLDGGAKKALDRLLAADKKRHADRDDWVPWKVKPIPKNYVDPHQEPEDTDPKTMLDAAKQQPKRASDKSPLG